MLIEKNDDELEQTDLLQRWHNVANDYLFSVFKPDVEELTSFIKAKEAEGVQVSLIRSNTISLRSIDATPYTGLGKTPSPASW